MLTADLLAQQLDGREYKQEMTEAEIQSAKEAGLVVVYGFSDDTTMFHGAIEAEYATPNGSEIFLTENGIFEDCPCDCIYSRQAKARAEVLKVIWCKGPYVWHYETSIPHASFEIVDNQPADNLKFCKGIVFSLSGIHQR